jgi:putative transposase
VSRNYGHAARVANIRADAVHKMTSQLAARYETILAEDLNVTGMTRNRRLARAIADQGFGQARQLLGYRTTWNGGRLVTADRWFLSSKTCSCCGAVKANLSLAERTHLCDACGLVLDRDVNAARNLLDLAASGAERINACGRDSKTRYRRACPAEPGTRRPAGDKTGTVPRQRGTAESERGGKLDVRGQQQQHRGTARGRPART